MKAQKLTLGTAPNQKAAKSRVFQTMLPLAAATISLFAIAGRVNAQTQPLAPPAIVIEDTTRAAKKDSVAFADSTKARPDSAKVAPAPAEPPKKEADAPGQDQLRFEFDEKNNGWVRVRGFRSRAGATIPDMTLDISSELREIGVPVSEAGTRMQPPKPVGPGKVRIAFSGAKGSIVLIGIVDSDITVKTEMNK